MYKLITIYVYNMYMPIRHSLCNLHEYYLILFYNTGIHYIVLYYCNMCYIFNIMKVLFLV